MAEKMGLVRNGKQLLMDGKIVAECASDAIAAIFALAVIRSKVTKEEAALFEAVFK